MPLLPRALLVACCALSCCAASAQDAARGAQRYLQLPDAPSCVSCHGPDPSQGRNNLLRAADNPQAIRKALTTVGVMGYLDVHLTEQDIADIAAYLGRVIVVADPASSIALWPVTLDFGTLPVGATSPEHRVRILNRGMSVLMLSAPQATGAGFALDGGCQGALVAGASCEVAVRWSATAAGNGAGALVLASDAAWSPLVVGLAARARDAGAGALSPLAPAAQLSFASTAVGESSSIDWTLISSGSEPVTLAASTLIGPQFAQFSIAGDCTAGRTLMPGSTCTLRVAYRPAAAGSQAHAALQVRSDGIDPGSVMLAGSAARASEGEEPAPPPSGGGCAIGPPARQLDPTLAILLAIGATSLWLRRRRGTRDRT